MKDHIGSLTGLRFAAALAVVVHHYGAATIPSDHVWARNLAGSGFLGVNLFFLLSGFVLAHAYPPHLPLDRRRFGIARFARVYPVYLQGLLLFSPFLVSQWLSERTLKESMSELLGVTFATLGLVQAWFPELALVWNPPSWSLSCEAFFYLVFPFTAPLIWRVGSRNPIAVLTGLWCVLILPSITWSVLHSPGGWSTGGLIEPHVAALTFNPLLRLPEFLSGIALRAAAECGYRFATGVVEVALLILIVMLAIRGPLPFLLVSSGLLDPLLAILVLGLSGGSGLLSTVLGSQLLQRLGEASYGMYILHVPLWLWLGWLVDGQKLLDPNGPGYFALYCAVTIVISIAVFRFVESPYRVAIRRWWESRPN